LLVQSFMTGEQKVLLSFEMSAFDQGVRKQKIRREHPEWSELQVKHEILRQAFLPDPPPEWLEKKMRVREEQEGVSR
jgi:hypothetical protein